MTEQNQPAVPTFPDWQRGDRVKQLSTGIYHQFSSFDTSGEYQASIWPLPGQELPEDDDYGTGHRWVDVDDLRKIKKYIPPKREVEEDNCQPEPAKKKKHKSKDRKAVGGGAKERWTILNNFVDFSMKELTPVEIKVWLVIYRNSKEGTARVSQRQIMRWAGCGLRHVNAAIKKLESKGLLKIVVLGKFLRKKDGKVEGYSSRYRVRGLIPVE